MNACIAYHKARPSRAINDDFYYYYDSDIKGHPNVDKHSFGTWKQRAIHEQREERKPKTAQYKADIACNDVLKPRLQEITKDVEEKAPHTSLRSLRSVGGGEEEGVEKDDPKLGDALVAGLKEHLVKIDQHQEKLRKDLQHEEELVAQEDHIHEGFESHYVPPKAAPAPVKNATTEKPTKKVTEVETLNTRSVAASPFNPEASSSSKAPQYDRDELPELTPALVGFSRLPFLYVVTSSRGSISRTWDHRDVYVPGASDALLVAAFRAQSNSDAKTPFRKDEPSMFFHKMISSDPRATGVFEKDVQDTYAHLVERVRISKAEESAAGREQIQLVAENPEMSITFNVLHGPPLEHLELEGPGFELNVSMEDGRKALQMRWDVFQSFDEPLQQVLQNQSLEEVNKVLDAMNVEHAEDWTSLGS
ncbi:hypothetical protein L227DRAFT_608191 [Lentinus tigrinus ALCF2SS1-6]|uniref:Hsp90 chaperone protein kinase-targeting subunit n=1 Tax=Lentinus tigrinus ALCF2SS1-6 TaxID=1328759 RepID=A0A5C2SIN5_9APHY|nr:hypothetical protein L227DRAFT_608191 [Lentinus tigrinus ALCF2SS1-6]